MHCKMQKDIETFTVKPTYLPIYQTALLTIKGISYFATPKDFLHLIQFESHLKPDGAPFKLV